MENEEVEDRSCFICKKKFPSDQELADCLIKHSEEEKFVKLLADFENNNSIVFPASPSSPASPASPEPPKESKEKSESEIKECVAAKPEPEIKEHKDEGQ